ncbi:MAG TPA: hypothetical protein VFG69_09605 [Nannocystaceae bacterium]|nr:hypothetical protein [Nannocystaceae bacterium]
MKRTDQERIERELKRREKHAKATAKSPDAAGAGEAGNSVSGYIKNLFALLHYDEQQVYNTKDDEAVFELLLNMKIDLPEEKWDAVLKSAIQKTKVVEKELAFNELKALLAD